MTTVRDKIPCSDPDGKHPQYFEDYVEASDTVKYANLSIELIKEHIDAERFGGACATTWFHDDIGQGMNYPFIVATGYDNDHIYINDPNDDYTDNGRTRYTRDASCAPSTQRCQATLTMAPCSPSNHLHPRTPTENP